MLPGFPSGALVGRWGLLALAAATLMFKMELPRAAWIFLAYLAVMAWWGPVWYEAVNLYIHAAFFVVLYCYAAKMEDLRRIAIGVGLGFAVNSAVVIAQYFIDWSFVPTITPASGLYFNRNMASEAAAISLALVMGYRLWWLVPGFAPTLLAGSRIPVMALGLAGAIAIYRYSRFMAALAIVLPALLSVAWLQGHGALYYAGVFDTLIQRFGTWYDGAQGFTFFGQGLGSWMINFPLYQTHSNPLELRWENAHNDAVQLLFELGIGGAVLIAVFLFRLANAERNAAFYALVVFAVEACFEFPIYQPVTGALAVVCAGYLFRRSDSLRSLVVRGGLRIRYWHAQPRGGIHQPGGGVIPAAARPTFGPGLSCYSESRFVPYQRNRPGTQV